MSKDRTINIIKKFYFKRKTWDIRELCFFYIYIKMDKNNIALGDTKIEKSRFHSYKNPI